MIVRVALLASLAFAVPALAADPVPVAKDDSEKVVCRSDVGTGSIIRPSASRMRHGKLSFE